MKLYDLASTIDVENEGLTLTQAKNYIEWTDVPQYAEYLFDKYFVVDEIPCTGEENVYR